MLGDSQRVSAKAKMAQSGVGPKASSLAMSAITEDGTPPPRLMMFRDQCEGISLPPRRRRPAMSLSGAEAACP